MICETKPLGMLLILRVFIDEYLIFICFRPITCVNNRIYDKKLIASVYMV